MDDTSLKSCLTEYFRGICLNSEQFADVTLPCLTKYKSMEFTTANWAYWSLEKMKFERL